MGATYDLWLHHKQGDDFAHFIEEAKGDIPAALRMWRDAFAAHAEVCGILAKALSGKNVDVQADVHFISFEPQDKKAEEALELLVHDGWLGREDFDEDEESAEDDPHE